MFPSLLAEETKHAVTEYLTTTFALADDDVREALQRFLLDPDSGIFQGPYLRVRTPYRPVDESWRSPLSWLPPGFTPYRHQAIALERLSTNAKAAEPTIVTTGTGSGKTESFLLPLLDHARRARERGEGGVKAILLYPMNALVTDQAGRIARLLHTEPELAGVTAGVYIGGSGMVTRSTPTALVDNREALRENPPDILLTNYRMLDLLLLRPVDRPLWQASRSSLQFVVLDEFHTYDGAQGTDVAMLLRRLGATLRVAEAGRPLGRITPVATSATLGGDLRSAELRAFAETIFGTPFGPACVVTEDRLTADEIVADVEHAAGVPEVDRLAPPDHDDEAALAASVDADAEHGWRALAEAALGGTDSGAAVPDDAIELGEALSRRVITLAVLQTLSGTPRTPSDAVEHLARGPAWPWGVSNKQDPARTELALLRFLAVLSAARMPGPAGATRPLVDLEAQLWVRELSRLLRSVTAKDSHFAWWYDGTPAGEETWLPAVHCRACGHSGWMAVQPEVGSALEGTATKVWQASATYSKRDKTRALLRTGPDDPDARWLDPRTLALAAERPDKDLAVPVVVTPSKEAARDQRCPSCGAADAIRFLGSSVATLASVALTSQFGSHLVPSREKKTLVFTDSVQDAAHRGAFIEGRAFAFNLRSAMVVALSGEATSIDVVAQRMSELPEADRYAVTPPDFVRRLGLEGEWLKGRGSRRARNLLEQRLEFQAQLEVGLNARMGRTLELTGAVSVDVDVDLSRYAALARETHANLPQLSLAELLSRDTYERWMLGLLDRLRTQGGIVHPSLEKYMRDDGRRWTIWGGSPAGMPRFPRGRPAPAFWTTGRDPSFDSLNPQGDSWLTNWTTRSLGVSAMEAKALLPTVAMMLADDGGPLRAVTSKRGNTIYGLEPARVVLHPVPDEALADGSALLRCDRCDHVQPVPSGRLDTWLEAACPRLRCGGRLTASPERTDNFYRRLYLSARVRRIVTHEHTGLLDRPQREEVERRFKDGGSPVDPNVLTCTPTLELGIDIGELSTVTLSSLPRATANYLQRVGRAGRSTGNAFMLATVPSTPRDLYYFADPPALIDGDVLPPGAYLNATEILQRQYLAFCIDRVADGTLGIGPMPNLLAGLLGKHLKEGAWLRSFADLVTEQAESLASEFLALYGDNLDPRSVESVRAYAGEGLRNDLARVATEWLHRRESLNTRIADLSDAVAELKKAGHRDEEQEDDLRRWRGELAMLIESRRDLGKQEALTGLVEFGLLPNYFLLDDATTLNVQLWWTSDDADDESRFRRIEHTIDRGSRTALTELAPGASFYVYGSRIRVDGLDLGGSGRPAWTTQRLCPDCGHGGRADERGACPRCGSAGYADRGACHEILPLRRVSAVQHRDDAVLDDDTEDRVRTAFTKLTGVSVAPEDVVHAWRLREVTFGAEYVRNATIRSVNVGRSDHLGGSRVTIAGETAAAPGFLTCTTCGVVAIDGDRENTKHRGWCAHRRGYGDWQCLLLSHELTTQAVRMLLPMSTLHVEARRASFSAALQLGLRLDFGGDPQHLAITTSSMPDRQRRPRQFVVLHDLVPGGTGYLDRFGQPDRLHGILRRAREFLVACPCRLEGRRACHRCLLGVAPPREVEVVDRNLALSLLDELLKEWEPEAVPSVANIDISTVAASELEKRFLELLKQWLDDDGGIGHSYTVELGPGGEELDLRLVHGEQIRRWRVRQQADVTEDVWTRPDLVITRQDAQDAKIAIYLDGREFHASPEHNRTADDAVKRDDLREKGYRVWSLTWTDVDQFERELAGRPAEGTSMVLPQVAATVGEAVVDARARACWDNPIDFLLAYLTDPASDVWGRCAERTVLAVLQHGSGGPLSEPLTTSHSQAHQALLELARGRSPAAGEGTVMIVPRTGRSGLPLFIMGESGGDGLTSLGVLAVLDDRDTVVGGPEHERHWRDWLRWANLLQFLTRPRHGDNLTQRMAAVSTRKSLDAFSLESLPVTPQPTPRVDVLSAPWSLALEYTEPELHGVGVQLAAANTPAPEAGVEVGDGEWQVDLGWEHYRLAVVLDDIPEREAWLAHHGWHVLRRKEYHSDRELADAVMTALEEST